MKEKYRCGVADIKLQRCFFFHYFFCGLLNFSSFSSLSIFFFFLKKKDQIKPYIIFLFRYFLTENLVGNLFGKCGPLYPDWTGFINAKTWTTRFHIFFHFIPYSIHLNVRQYFINPGIGLVLIGAGGATAARLEPVDGAAIWQQCHLSFFFSRSLINIWPELFNYWIQVGWIGADCAEWFRDLATLLVLLPSHFLPLLFPLDELLGFFFFPNVLEKKNDSSWLIRLHPPVELNKFGNAAPRVKL